MKPGYSLIEVTIGIFLASMLAISLFQSVRNTSKTVELANDLMDFDMRLANFHHQFERDTIGIFVPEKPAPPKEAPAKQDDGSNSDTKKQDRAATDDSKEKVIQQQKPEKFPDKLFYSVNNNEGRVTECTFITSNPVRVYEKAHNVTVKPRMVRVMYRLIADPTRTNSFTLFRQESDDLEVSVLDAKAQKPIRGYALLSNIKKMSFEFVYPEKKEAPTPRAESAKAPTTQGAHKPESSSWPEVAQFVTRFDWPFKTADEAREKNVPSYPQFIVANVELWDNARASQREFKLTYPIASFTLFEKKKKKAKPVKQAPKPEQPRKDRINLSLVLTPKTEEKLAELGQKMYKVIFEGNIPQLQSTSTDDSDFLMTLNNKLAETKKSAS